MSVTAVVLILLSLTIYYYTCILYYYIITLEFTIINRMTLNIMTLFLAPYEWYWKS